MYHAERSSTSASIRRFGTAIMRAKASSATAMADACGVLRTSMPRSFAALASMLSIPTPPRTMSLSFGADAIRRRMS